MGAVVGDSVVGVDVIGDAVKGVGAEVGEVVVGDLVGSCVVVA